jgi:hypothetical protein
MSSLDDIKVRTIAVKVAKRYKRKCWWADLDELTHEAVVAIMEASKPGKWDPDVGVPIEAYVWRAAIFACKHFLWKNSSPVNASTHQEKELRGIHRAEFSKQVIDDQCALVKETPYHAYLEADWRKRVKEQLEKLVVESPEGDLAAAVLLESTQPADMEGNLRSVYKARKELHKQIRNSYPLYKLFKELPQ